MFLLILYVLYITQVNQLSGKELCALQFTSVKSFSFSVKKKKRRAHFLNKCYFHQQSAQPIKYVKSYCTKVCMLPN